ncbi:tRNA dimethylallyltransferase 9 [Raphanus sativus]|nr:tRNA dimethylallyltransferase 9 [Raphanus sativus]
MVISCGVFSTRSCCSRLQPPCLVLRRRLCGATACSDSVNGSTSNKKRNSEKEKVIVISGPTGAGKSRLALELAKRLNGEIISADSVQVYKGLDVGSAKPSASYRKEVPHHLIDILHPSQDYSVGQFFEDGRQVTKDILSRGRVPIVTGGTGLYLRWFMYGKPDVPNLLQRSSPRKPLLYLVMIGTDSSVASRYSSFDNDLIIRQLDLLRLPFVFHMILFEKV